MQYLLKIIIKKRYNYFLSIDIYQRITSGQLFLIEPQTNKQEKIQLRGKEVFKSSDEDCFLQVYKSTDKRKPSFSKGKKEITNIPIFFQHQMFEILSSFLLSTKPYFLSEIFLSLPYTI